MEVNLGKTFFEDTANAPGCTKEKSEPKEDATVSTEHPTPSILGWSIKKTYERLFPGKEVDKNSFEWGEAMHRFTQERNEYNAKLEAFKKNNPLHLDKWEHERRKRRMEKLKEKREAGMRGLALSLKKNETGDEVEPIHSPNDSQLQRMIRQDQTRTETRAIRVKAQRISAEIELLLARSIKPMSILEVLWITEKINAMLTEAAQEESALQKNEESSIDELTSILQTKLTLVAKNSASEDTNNKLKTILDTINKLSI